MGVPYDSLSKIFFIKQCYHIVRSVERQKTEEHCNLKEQEAIELSRSLKIKTPINKITFVGHLLF